MKATSVESTVEIRVNRLPAGAQAAISPAPSIHRPGIRMMTAGTTGRTTIFH